MGNSEIVTIILALYGACLSTILGLREWRRSRPGLRITAGHGYMVDMEDGQYSEPILVVKAANIGSGSIFLESTGFMNRDRTKQAVTTPYPKGVLPAQLGEGQSLTSAYACRWLRKHVDHEKIVASFFTIRLENTGWASWRMTKRYSAWRQPVKETSWKNGKQEGRWS